MTRRVLSGNIGEWSEIYAFLKILYDGIIYAADEHCTRLDGVILEVFKIEREDCHGVKLEYRIGENIQIWRHDEQLAEIDREVFQHYSNLIYSNFYNGRTERTGSFSIEELTNFFELIFVRKLKASSANKVDIILQLYDVRSGQHPTVGFSIKSDIGALPTLLNAGQNTKFRYRIEGMDDRLMLSINSITEGNYLISRMQLLFQDGIYLEFDSMNSDRFENNLKLIDLRMPEIYARMILIHFKNTDIKDCVDLVDLLSIENPLNVSNTDIYKYKFKKLLVASALGMTPGANWDGSESATGGYLIVKRSGELLYYNLYNRNLLEDYLLNNTKFDRPGMHRYDYGYVFKVGDEYFINFNIQIRFKSTEIL